MEDLFDLDFTAPAPTTAVPGFIRPTSSKSSYSANYYAPTISRTPSPLPPPLQSSSRPLHNDTGIGGGSGSGGDAFSSLFSSPVYANGNGHSKTSISMGAKLASSATIPSYANQVTMLVPDRKTNASSPVDPTAGKKAIPLTSDPSWDFDLLAPSPVRSPASSSTQQVLDDPFSSFASSSVPATFTDVNQQEESDLLGLLSRPVPVPSPQQPRPFAHSATTRVPTTASSTPSPDPPPHILGQLVEMGFSIIQARAALRDTQTKNGEWSVERALEGLVGLQQSEERGTRSSERNHGREEGTREQEREAVIVPAVGRRARERAALEAEREREREDKATSVGQVYQEQANELLAQASKLGFSVFKSANAYWETGRATILKAIDDQVGEATNGKGEGGSSRIEGKKGRPKWMTEDVNLETEEDLASVLENRASPKARRKEVVREVEEPKLLFEDSDPEDSLFAPPPVPSRPHQSSSTLHGSFIRAGTPSVVSSERRREKSRYIEPTAAPPPALRPSRPQRPVITASPPQLALSAKHKAIGNDYFKLGRFTDAVSSYSLAESSLPARHIQLISIWNNRASAYLKNGDASAAVEDCSNVLKLVFEHDQNDKIDLTLLDEPRLFDDDIDLKQVVGKAWSRRAKAWEMNEKWDRASEDWNLLLQGGPLLCKSAGGIKLVREGVTRCRKMTMPAASTTSQQKLSNQHQAISKPVVVVTASAVNRLRTANLAAEAEDDLRLSLKDAVDAKISSWKSGKEANLRALIASLDSVLWSGLGWKTVGMGELLSNGQLKLQYIRAIGKVHPDKLNVNNTTVEQRMIAGGVFSGLNDAWNSSK